MHTNTESRNNNVLKSKRVPFAQSLSRVGNALHVVLLVVPVVIWCAWCVWCVVNLLTQGIRIGTNKLHGAAGK